MKSVDIFSGGPLAFPITPFGTDGEVDLPTFERFLSWLFGFGTPAVFVGCGTGELSSLDEEEVAQLVQAAKGLAPEGTAVVAGVGHGMRIAKRALRAAAKAGADAALVFPPYLLVPSQEGLFAYYREVALATDLPLILYQRDNARFEPETILRLADLPTIVGLKDGLGDVELIQRIVTTVGDRLHYFNGMPTAETFQAAYRGLAVPHYSSAVFNFVPEVSHAFYAAAQVNDESTQHELLREFFVPLAKLRRAVPGYAVSLVKAGVASRWGEVGLVRPPLVPAEPAHVAALRSLIDAGLNVIEHR